MMENGPGSMDETNNPPGGREREWGIMEGATVGIESESKLVNFLLWWLYFAF